MIAALHMLSLGTALAQAQPTLAPAPAPPPTASERFEQRPFVFTFLSGLTFGLSIVPSVDLAFLFACRLPNTRWALGYQLTFSGGNADRYNYFSHRHHITAIGSFGKRDRGFASAGGGVAVLALYPIPELEGRVGVRFGKRRSGLLGAQLRVDWNTHWREQAPVPLIGLVLGVTLL